MKKLLLCLCLAGPLTAVAALAPQNGDKNLSASDTEVVRLGDGSVIITFKLEAGDRVTARNRSLVVRPSLAGGGSTLELPPIVIRGDRARVAAENLAMTSAGINSEGGFVSTNGSVTEYRATVPWQDWMEGASLELSGLNAGPGDITEVTIGTVADNLLLGPAYTELADLPYAPVQTALAPTFYERSSVQEPPVQTPVLAPLQSEVSATPATPPAVQPAPEAPRQSRFVWPEPRVEPETAEPTVVQRQLTPTTDAPQDRGAVVQRRMTSGTPRDYSPERGFYNAPERARNTGTVADELAARFTFLEPVAKFNRARSSAVNEVVAFDYNMPLVFGTATAQTESDASRFVEMTRQGAVYFRFERGSSEMSRDLGENNTMYVDLISSILVLNSNPSTRISRIVVVGFSSPEGQLEEKETLAMERASVARDFVVANSRVDPSLVSIYNGSVDWVTLRELVSASNMPEKYTVLEILDNAPTWNASRRGSRLGRLMALNDGEVFNYMRRNFFPQMRQTGAYVKVYYENVR